MYQHCCSASNKLLYFIISMSFKDKITFDKFIRGLVVIIGFVLLYLLLRRLSGVLIPFFVAWIVAYMLYPIVCFFQYKCRLRSRTASILLTFLLIILAIGAFCQLILPPVFDEVVRLKDIVVSYVSSSSNGRILPAEVEDFLKKNVDVKELTGSFTFKDVTDFVDERLPQVVNLIYGSVDVLIGIVSSFIAIIYMFFILLDYEQLNRGLMMIFPRRYRPFVRGLLTDVKVGMNEYFRGQSLIAFLVGVLFAIGFVIIDFPLAIPLGLFIGFLNLVPYMQGIGLIPTVVLAILKAHDTGESFWLILFAAIMVFIVVQTIQDWILTPRIMGHVTGLNPAMVFLSLSVWGSLLGIIGLIIALPLSTLIISYYRRYVVNDDIDDECENPKRKKKVKQAADNAEFPAESMAETLPEGAPDANSALKEAENEKK